MRYIDAQKLVKMCVEEEILNTHEGRIAVYMNPKGDFKEGWYLVDKENMVRIVMKDKEGQDKLIEALKKKNIKFEKVNTW